MTREQMEEIIAEHAFYVGQAKAKMNGYESELTSLRAELEQARKGWARQIESACEWRRLCESSQDENSALKKEVEELKNGVPMQPVPQDRDGKCWVLQPDGSWKESAWVKMPAGKVMYCGSEPTFQMTGLHIDNSPENS